MCSLGGRSREVLGHGKMLALCMLFIATWATYEWALSYWKILQGTPNTSPTIGFIVKLTYHHAINLPGMWMRNV